MAKALLGHVGGPDPRMVAEMRRLQQRVRDLEAELVRLQTENDALAAVADSDVMALSAKDREPALT
jgi:cell division protein FtsB